MSELTPDQVLARDALAEVVEIYQATDPEENDRPLSGADVVAELGDWIERNRKLLRVLGVVSDDTD